MSLCRRLDLLHNSKATPALIITENRCFFKWFHRLRACVRVRCRVMPCAAFCSSWRSDPFTGGRIVSAPCERRTAEDMK